MQTQRLMYRSANYRYYVVLFTNSLICTHQSENIPIFSQHNSLCSQSPIFPKITLANLQWLIAHL